MAKKQKKNIAPASAPAESKPAAKPVVQKTQAPKQTSKSNLPEFTPVADFFDKAGGKAWLIAAGILAFIAVVVFRDYLFQSKLYMFKDIACDSYNLSYPNLYNTADYIAHYGIPKWSFKSGMGQSLFPFCVRDPFDFFLYFTGKNGVVYWLGFFEFIKVLIAGTIFYFYLKQLSLTSFTATVGAMMFTFCSFMMEGSAWYIFTFEAMNFALLLLAFELLFQKGNWYLFPIAIFGIGISMPFNLYVYGLFIAFYSVLRHLQVGTFDFKKIGGLYLQMLGLGVLGLILSGPFLLENIVQLIESPRGSGNSSLSAMLMAAPMFDMADKMEFGTGMMRLFSTDMMYSGDAFKGWQNILEAPMYYCGLPALLLMPQVFPFLEKRVRNTFLVFLAIWVLPMIFPYFRRAFWLFTGDYYRAYSFFVGVVFILYGLQALDYIIKKGKINLPILAGSLGLYLVLLYYPYFEDKDFVNPAMQVFAAVMLLGYAVVIFMMGRKGENVNLRYIMMGMLVVELLYMAGTTIGERNAMTPEEQVAKKGYNDYTVDAISFINKNDKSFFRVDKAYSSGLSRFATMNDAMVQDFYGTCSYNPFNQLYYIKFLQEFGVAQKGNELDSRWARNLISKPILECENQVKYMLGKGNNINPFWRIMCDSIATFGDVKVFKNKNYLPLGYAYDKYIKESNFEKLSSVQKEFISLRASILDDKDITKVPGMKEMLPSDTFSLYIFTPDTLTNEINALRRDTLVITKFNDNNIEGKVAATEDELLYLSVPYDGGWTLKVDGQPKDKIVVDGGMTGVFLNKGQHQVSMSFDLRYFNKGVYMGLFGIALFAGLWFWTKKKPRGEASA